MDKEKLVHYVGRTKNVQKRIDAHKNSSVGRSPYELKVIATNLNYAQARVLEQVAMLYFHTLKPVSEFGIEASAFNQINGISKKNWKKYLPMVNPADLPLSYTYNQITNEILNIMEGSF